MIEIMMSDQESKSTKQCACKGIRTCLVCEPTTIEQKLPNRRETYLYCQKCEKAWLQEEGSTNDHSNHSGQSIQFPGVYVKTDFLTEIEEKTLVSEVEKQPWVESQSGRRKQDYGPKVNFKKKKIKTASFTGLPEFSESIIDKLTNLPLLKNFKVVEQCNLEYDPKHGAAIDPHFDDFWLWGEHLVTLNLLSDTFYTMSDPQNEDYIVKIYLPPRSLVVLYGPARFKWKHAIERGDINARRLAITLRELTPEFLEDGPKEEQGRELLKIAYGFKGLPVGVAVI
ncbi:unnamed protein product [Owenia fusiformis]|uniref:Uncharacterized protein n=1 Tax=Owenia fusiformis TaxID=6347 RepID=A0A8J1UT88_OWEFU|nr:unnamed protein product [Owenia fusiformis]